MIMKPDYWLCIIEPNENTTYYPFLGSFDQAKIRAASLASHTDSIDRVIIYSGYFNPENDVAPSSALILATYSGKPFNQSTQYRGKFNEH
jgi:hypothetical protein